MKKRGRLVACLSLLIICFTAISIGVFAATKPELKVTGTISYDASNVNVLVLGKFNDVKNSSGTTLTNDYPSANDDASNYTSNEKIQQPGKYLDYTTQSSGTMATWQLGSVKFYSDGNQMMQNASISVKIKNFSDFPVKVDIQPKVDDSKLSSFNVTRIQNKSSFVLEGVSSEYNSDEYCVYFSVSQQADDIDNLDIGFTVYMRRYFRDETENDGYTFAPIKQTSASPLTYALWSASDGVSTLAGARLTKFDNNSNSTYGTKLVIPNTAMVDTNNDGVADTRVPVLEVGDASANVATTNANLTCVEFGSYVKKINANAFTNLNGIDLALPKSLQVASQGFVGGTIENLLVASDFVMTTGANNYSVTGKIFADSTRYVSFNGQVLCDVTAKRIVRCSQQADDINLTQSNATTIDDYAFSQCANLIILILPDSAETVGDNSFAGCTGLKNSTNLFDGTYYVGTPTNPKKFLL